MYLALLKYHKFLDLRKQKENFPKARENSKGPGMLMVPPSFDYFKLLESDCHYREYSHNVIATILVFQNNETAAILVFQTNTVGVGLFSYVKTFFCSYKVA